jgi:hypothetical protein
VSIANHDETAFDYGWDNRAKIARPGTAGNPMGYRPPTGRRTGAKRLPGKAGQYTHVDRSLDGGGRPKMARNMGRPRRFR